MRKILKVLEPGQSVVIIPPSGEYRTVTKNLAADQRRYGLFLDIKFERVLIMVKSEDKVIDGVLVVRSANGVKQSKSAARKQVVHDKRTTPNEDSP